MSANEVEQAMEDVDDMAAYWLVRLESPDCTPKDRLAFDKWKREDVLHEEAYERLRRGNGLMDQFLSDPDLLAMVDEAREETRLPAWREKPFRVAAMAASLVLVVGLSIALVTGGYLAPQTAQSDLIAYETAIGERSMVTLADGTTVTLNTDSRIEVHYSSAERIINLTKGQGYFEVAKDAHRPFVVEAGYKRVVALGTVFDVRYKTEDRVEVTLVEGLVDVDFVEPGAQSTNGVPETINRKVSLKPGERLVASLTVEPEIIRPNISEETSWRSGKLVFRDRALSSVVEELNRYSTQKIVLNDDVRMADLEVSGVFNTGRASTFVTAIEAMHPLVAERTARNEVTLVWRD